MDLLDEQTKSQLNVISEMNEIFKSIGGRYWLRGGWAIDFLLGRVTRPHEDLDLVTWVHNREGLAQMLMDAGFERIPVSERQTDFRKSNVDIQFLYLTTNGDESIIPNGLPEWVWRSDALLPQVFTLNGITANVLNPRQLLEEKEVYEKIGRKLRQKDLESKRILQSIIDNKQFGESLLN
ncbi:hypothetical protein BVG16_12650 [Paenibacillus selenitireducens]|uniref:Aminoglycoside adenylyltransferase n=1 Tax=Paenibacillus selenitireducens TaxID=1324314 RepID=A0A1T2XFP0_9BACL|nr:hypothetical protein [Paenibacillus selenitireducens]OPA78699.1 hypothetical protein BVG16_12650 [Paenibacillus selenitireducens]